MKKKSNNLFLVCFEINLVHVPSNTWWLDSGVIIHVVNFMKGFLTTRSLIGGEKYIEMRSQLKFEVATIEIYKLVLGISHILYLHDNIPSTSKNLISWSTRDFEGYVFNFGNQFLRLYKNFFLISPRFYVMGYLKLMLIFCWLTLLFFLTLHINVGVKHDILNKRS